MGRTSEDVQIPADNEDSDHGFLEVFPQNNLGQMNEGSVEDRVSKGHVRETLVNKELALIRSSDKPKLKPKTNSSY